MTLCRIVVGVALFLLPAFSAGQDSSFDWDWRGQQVIGRNDSSIGNTSKLTEPERSSLIDAIVLRLQKPMSEAGYDDDRIREIASTTRIRFVDLGDGQPLLLATSLGLEGGCDAMSNCPLWIFRRTDEGFLSLLTAIAASYTVQPVEGATPDLVLMHHITPRQSGLKVYHYADLKLVDGGCFEANWPQPSDDPTKLMDPDIQPCKEQRLNQYGLPEVKPLHPHPDEQTAHPVAIVPAPQATQPPAEAPAAEQPKEQPQQSPASPEAPPAEPPKEQATPTEPAAQEAPKSEAPKSEESQPAAEQKAPDANQEAPKQEQAQPSAGDVESTSKPSKPAPEQQAPAEQQPPASNQEQPKSEQQPSPEQQAPPDNGQSAPVPKGDEAQQPPAEQPPANQDQSKPDQAQPTPEQRPSSPDAAQPPAEDKPAEPAPPPPQQ